jgi:two-component system response regulator CpxR
MRALVVDDDVGLCELLQETLAKSGVQLDMAHDGETGVARCASESFDVVILDVMMPEADGFEVLQRVRMTSDVPIIMLTARGDEKDRIRGLELGADDYVPKPFSPDELLARMKAVTRRMNRSQSAEAIILDEVTFHPSRNEVEIDGESIVLTGVEAVILRLLMTRAGEAVSRDHLYKTVLNRPPSPYDRSLDNHVSNLRKKLGPTAKGSPRILSVRGVGYQFAR